MPGKLADVARQARVSEATVSRVLNGKPGISDATRQAVLTALDVIGYERPTHLRSRKARMVGLVVPELAEPDLPGGCRGGRRRARAAWVQRGALHPHREHVGGAVRRDAARAPGLGNDLRRRAVRRGRRTARPLHAVEAAAAAGRARECGCGQHRLPARFDRRRGRDGAGVRAPHVPRVTSASA